MGFLADRMNIVFWKQLTKCYPYPVIHYFATTSSVGQPSLIWEPTVYINNLYTIGKWQI